MKKFNAFLLTDAIFVDKIMKSDEKLHRLAKNRREYVVF